MKTTIRNLTAAMFIAASLQAHAQATLTYALKRRSKQFMLCGSGMLLIGSIYAQTMPVQSAQDSVVQITAEAAALSQVSASALPPTGTFWVVTPGFNGRLQMLPYPSLPPDLSNLPTYAVAGNIFLVDDTAGQIMPMSARRMSSAQAVSTVQAQAKSVAGLIAQIEFPTNGGDQPCLPNSPVPMVFTNGLWLAFSNQPPYPVTTNLWLRLHGTIYGEQYQLLSTTNLTCTNWVLGEVLWDADDDYTDFLPVPMSNAMTFYRAHYAEPVMQIWNKQNSVELNPTNASGQVGIIGIQNGDQAHGLETNGMIVSTNDITVYYTVSGTAQGGIDYSNLPGVLTIPAGQWSADIVIQPIADGLKSDQTIILTLAQNTNYLIDIDWALTTNTLFANPEVLPIAYGDIEWPCPNTRWPFSLHTYALTNLPLTYTILTWPTNGTLDTSALPAVAYTSTNCYEGQDSFAFDVSYGRFTSAPATVTLYISSQITAPQISVPICRDTQGYFTLGGANPCSQTLNYALLSYPLHGTLDTSGIPSITYTLTNTNFSGMDNFNYQVIDECGYSVTAAVNITVGDPNISPNGQTVITGTNQPVNITLTADSPQNCANAFDYLIVSRPANGTLDTNALPNVTYTPYPNFEGVDSFQFTASDGVWTSTNSATVTNLVVAGPILMFGCNPFGTGPFVLLNWSLDSTVLQMEQQYKFITGYNIYRSPVSGGPYTNIYTSTDLGVTSYMDTNVVAGETNYYVATFEFQNNGITYESPFSNEILATGRNPSDLIAADAIWDVWDVSTNQPVIWLGNLQAPFGSPADYASSYHSSPPLAAVNNTNWSDCYMWSNSLTINLTNYTSQQIANVVYTIAIDNDYALYVNNQLIDHTNWGAAQWLLPFKPLNAATNLVPGNNSIAVVIWGDCDNVNYFSMIVTTNTCGY